MLDFTSALYLGMHHPSSSLRPWSRFTTGVPAAVTSPPGSQPVAQQFAALQGCEYGLLGTSTLHLFWDLFGLLSERLVAIHADSGIYPIARWGIERAASRCVPVREFNHHDVVALRRSLSQSRTGRRRPLLVTDGFCPDCGEPAPLDVYLATVRSFGGSMIVDDTQALGIFGSSPGPDLPYGTGGGGMLRYFQIGGPSVLTICSLAKAFGTPVAVLSGSRVAVTDFELNSETRMHCSPPSAAVVSASEHALAINRNHGDALRLRLSSLVARFRQRAARAGLRFSGGLFPVQTLAPAPGVDPGRLYKRLLDLGIRTVLHSTRTDRGPRISFLITARHVSEEIDSAVDAAASATLRNRAI